MFIRSIAAATLLLAAAGTHAQSKVDKAFTATGAGCDKVTWSQDALAKYPRIASACQEVMERDGRYFVKFEGTVQRVADRGRNVTINFKNGDRLTLQPPENMSLFVDGRPRKATALRPGDQLNFYVPEDQLAAQFFAGADAQTAPEVEAAPIVPPDTRVATADEPAPLPKTAGVLPWIAVAGWLLIGVGAVLTLLRRWRATTLPVA